MENNVFAVCLSVYKMKKLNCRGYSNLKVINIRSSENPPITTATSQSNYFIEKLLEHQLTSM